MTDPGCYPWLGTGAIGWRNHGKLFQQAIDFGEGSNSRVAIFKAFFEHSCRPESKQDIEEFVCVTAQECPGEHRNVPCRCSQCAQCVTLGRISSLQFVHFIGDGVIEEAIHVPPDEVNWCKASNLLPICLPKRAVDWPAGVICQI